jgi:hypothetical protein
MAGRKTEVAYCHIHHGGLIGKDSAALYTGGWATAGLEWHHNWIHSATEKCARADDQSRNMSVHHNVIFDCGESFTDDQSHGSGLGIVLKGNGHLLFANTVWGANNSDVCMPSCVERLKSFRPQFPRQLQNDRSQLFNMAAHSLGGACGCSNNGSHLAPCGGNKTAIFGGPPCTVAGIACDLVALKLQDPEHFDFRPTAGSPLVDAGAIIPPYTDGYHGTAPDVGAYEHGEEAWRAGCQGLGGRCVVETISSGRLKTDDISFDNLVAAGQGLFISGTTASEVTALPHYVAGVEAATSVPHNVQSSPRS